MRKYSWIVVVMLIGCIVAFASCRRMEEMMDPVLPEVETVEPVMPDTQMGDPSMLTNSLIIAEARVINAPLPEPSNSPTAPQVEGNLPEVTAAIGSIILLPFEYSGTNTLAGCIVYIPGVAAYYEIPYTGGPDDLPSVIPVNLSENVSVGSFIEVCYGVYDNQGQASNFLNTVVTVVMELPAEPMVEMEMPVVTSPAVTSFEYLPDNATLGLWHFDGSNIVDSSQNALQGMIEGNAQWSSNQDWNKGTKQGHSFSFDGNTLITLGTPNVLKPTTAITVEAWVYPTALSARWNLIFTKWGHGEVEPSSYHLSLQFGVPEFYIYTEDGQGVASAEQPVELGRWHHIAGTYDSEQIKIYVDGVEVGSTDHSGDITSGIPNDGEEYEVVIGSKHHRVFNWIGLIDEVRISSIARQPEELSPNFVEPTISEVME